MSERNVSLGHALHLLAVRDLDALIAALGDARRPHRGVHEARKAIRRLRSVLQLAADCFGDAGERLDADLKGFGLGLSALRDAHVAVELCDRRRRDERDRGRRVQWAAVRLLLIAERRRVLDATLTDDPQFEARRTELESRRTALDALPWADVDAETVRDALKRSLRRLDRAERHGRRRSADAELRHAWRKRLRRLRMQWSALRTIRTETDEADVRDAVADVLRWLQRRAPKRREIERCSDELGAEQDTHLLDAALEKLPADVVARLD